MSSTIVGAQEDVESSHLSNKGVPEGPKAHFLVDCRGILRVSDQVVVYLPLNAPLGVTKGQGEQEEKREDQREDGGKH